jgi:hypothetical protein
VVNGYGIPPVIYEPFTIFAATELPTTGRELTAAVPDSNWYLAGIWEMHSAAGGAGATLKFRKVADNSAANAAAGANVVELTGVGGATPFDVTQSVRIWRPVPLISNTGARTFRPLNRLVVQSAGTLSPYADAVIIVKWMRVS